jgi:hypothetical protein
MKRLTLENVSDEEFIRAICEPDLIGIDFLDDQEIGSWGLKLDRIDENSFLRAILEPSLLNLD